MATPEPRQPPESAATSRDIRCSQSGWSQSNRVGDESIIDDFADHVSPHNGSGLAILGSTALFLGAFVIGLSVVENVAGLPFRMPRSWYVNHSLWILIGMMSFIGGCAMLRNRQSTASDRWKPTRPGRRFERIVFYTKPGCHLCDQAKDTLLKYRGYLPGLDEVNIAPSPELVERYGTCIPVVEIDGKVRFRGRVNEWLLRRLIEATPPHVEPARNPKRDANS